MVQSISNVSGRMFVILDKLTLFRRLHGLSFLWRKIVRRDHHCTAAALPLAVLLGQQAMHPLVNDLLCPAAFHTHGCLLGVLIDIYRYISISIIGCLRRWWLYGWRWRWRCWCRLARARLLWCATSLPEHTERTTAMIVGEDCKFSILRRSPVCRWPRLCVAVEAFFDILEVSCYGAASSLEELLFSVASSELLPPWTVQDLSVLGREECAFIR